MTESPLATRVELVRGVAARYGVLPQVETLIRASVEGADITAIADRLTGGLEGLLRADGLA